ncbi:DNA-binding response regulator, OmpR family, contains REC and winged-helix (wHTH) domain [Variovorax sp. YR216]|nr:DNA-binding response regulator, OmpR family, contains REC and winged-helix (wHTH) domain [Variovorax sp. YR216]
MRCSAARRRVGVLAYSLRTREFARRIFRAAGYAPLVFVSLDELIEVGPDASMLEMLLVGEVPVADSLGRPFLQSLRELVGPKLPLLLARFGRDAGPVPPTDNLVVASPRYFPDLCMAVLSLFSAIGIDKAPLKMAWGDYTFEPARRVVAFDGRQTGLDPVAFDIALELFFRAGQIVPKRTLTLMLPPDEQGLARHRIDNIGSVIKELRSSLRLRGQHGWDLETCPRLGYRLTQTERSSKPAGVPMAIDEASAQVFSPAC